MEDNYDKELIRKIEDALKYKEKLKETLRKQERENECEIAAIMESANKEIAELNKEISERDQIIANLISKKEHLAEDNARLKSIVSNNSHNSSNPPSTDEKHSKKKNKKVNK